MLQIFPYLHYWNQALTQLWSALDINTNPHIQLLFGSDVHNVLQTTHPSSFTHVMFLWTPSRSYQLHGIVLPTWTGRYKSTPIPKLNGLGGTFIARAPFAEPTDFSSNISSSIFVIFQSRKTCYRKRIGFYANKERATAGHRSATLPSGSESEHFFIPFDSAR